MAPKPDPLQAGRKAPAFRSKTFTGQEVSLSDFKGKYLALYFYPKDNTTGCSNQAKNLQNRIETLEAKNISIVGVSPDDEISHQRFAEKYGLSFPLIADTGLRIINKYGVWGEKKNYGKIYMGLQRTTFLIDGKGVIQHVFKRPKTGEHAEEILAKM